MHDLKYIYSKIISIDEVQRQTLVAIVWKVVLTFVGFFSTVYFARTLDANTLGAYFLFVTYFSLINLLTDGGIGGAAIKRISEGKEQNEYFSAFLIIRTLLVIFIIGILYFFQNYFYDIKNEGLFTWLLIALIVSLIHGAITIGVAGCGKMGIHATSGFIKEMSRIIFQVLAIFIGYGAAGLAGGFVLGLLVAAIIEFRFFELNLVRFNSNHVKNLSTFSFWLFLSSSGTIIYSHADTVLIGYYLSNADVAVYKIVMQITSFAALTTLAIRSTLWPKVSYWSKNQKKGLIEKSLAKAFTYSLILAIPMFVGGSLLGDKLLYYLFGEQYSSGYFVLVILLVVQIANVFQFLFTTYMGALDIQKSAFKVTAIGVSINIILNIILIPSIGILGAAFATLFTISLNALLAKQAISNLIEVKIEYISILNILKASSIMGLFVGGYRLFVPLSNIWLVLFPVFLGGLIYSFFVLKFDKEICNYLRKIAIQLNIPWTRIFR